MVLQKQMYQTVRVYYGVRPAAAWENHNIYGMQKATFKYHLGIFLNTQEIWNMDIKVPISTLIGPRGYLTIRLCMAWSRGDDDCHK